MEKTDGNWENVGSQIDVYIGRNGLAPAYGLCDINHTKLPMKKEGDGKAPSGIFSIGSLFGDKNTDSFNMPYFKASKDLHCIDDSNSKFYNQIIPAQNGYTSYETMLRDDGLYNLGATVNYNNTPAIKPRGSCIFLHISANRPTAGCTSMKERELKKVLLWLKQKRRPLLVQLPESIYNGLDLGSLIK